MSQEIDSPAREKTIEHRFVVESECFGWRLDRFLKKKIPRLSRERVQRVIRGDCVVDGRPCKPGQTVSPGQTVTFRRPAPKEPDAPRDILVIAEDPSFYIIGKPAGLAMHPTAKYHFSTLTAVLRERFPGEELQLTHRIDLETSGLVVVARCKAAAIAMKRAFAKRLVKKRYLAVVHGRPRDEEGVIDLPLGIAGGLVRVKMATRPDGLASRTSYRVLDAVGARFTLLECAPETGRQHQIRAHLDAIGHPIVGDKLYPDETIFANYQDYGWDAVSHQLPLARQALHAAWIEFPHPATGELVSFSAPMAKDLEDFISAETFQSA